jgi:hypothetical protein
MLLAFGTCNIPVCFATREYTPRHLGRRHAEANFYLRLELRFREEGSVTHTTHASSSRPTCYQESQ